MKTVLALFFPLIALWLAITVWGVLAIYSPFSLSLWRTHPEFVAYSSLVLVLLPLLWLAAWLFRRTVVVHLLGWSIPAALIAIAAFVVPSLFELTVEWSIPTTFTLFAVGITAVFPALVWLTRRSSGTPQKRGSPSIR